MFPFIVNHMLMPYKYMTNAELAKVCGQFSKQLIIRAYSFSHGISRILKRWYCEVATNIGHFNAIGIKHTLDMPMHITADISSFRFVLECLTADNITALKQLNPQFTI